MKEPVKSQEELNDLLKAGAKPQPVQVPAYYVTSIRVALDPNNVSLTFSKAQPVDISLDNQMVHASALIPAVILDMSPQTAKDLSILLQGQIEEHEKSWGVIETEFTRRRAGAS